MDKEPSTLGGIKLHIPSELRDEIDVLAEKNPNKAATPADLDDNQKRWLVVGICLHSVISPALRKYVASMLTVCYNELIHVHKIDTQIYRTHLQKDPQTGAFLNYEAVNNNKVRYGKHIAKYDFTIKNAVDVSKLYLQTHMAHFTGFDETCDSSALLALILNIAKFDPVIKSDADNVRKYIRNPWAHCDFTDWDSGKYSSSFQLTKKIVKDLKLGLSEEKLIVEELEKWEINGQRFLSGTTHGFELVNELHQQTRILAVYTTLVETEAEDSFMRIRNELEKFEIIFNKIAQLDTDIKQGFCEIDKSLVVQDKTLKIHETEIKKLKENLSKCACQDFHDVNIECWKEEDVMFAETPIVKLVSQILESDKSVLLVGEPGIGKSMLMHHIALQLLNKNEYSIIPCSGIQDVCCHFKTDIRQMFVLDDICGRFTVSLSDIEYLLKHDDSLKRMLEKGNCKIAATCRLDIYNDEQFQASCSLFTSNVFNLSAEYSKEDKLTICSKYLKETNIQLLRDQNELFTPLMCYLYSKNENFNLTDFLHSPYGTYRDEWKKLQSIDPYKYCALFLCVINNGVIKESLFDIYNENRNMDKKALKDIFDVCGINRSTSKSKLKKVFDGIIGTYVRKIGCEYRVIHDQMFDFMCHFWGKNDTLIRSLLRYANIKVINERTQLESITERYCRFTINISKNYEQDYFERIKKDLQSGKLMQCFSNAQMKHANYRASFLKVLKSIDNDNIIDDQIIKENIITPCFRGYYEIVEYFISKDVDLDKEYSYMTPLTAACYGKHEKIVQLLIEKGCDVNQDNGMSDTSMIAVLMRQNEKIVHRTIDSDVDQLINMRDTPLTVACNSGNEKIVQLILDKGGYVNQVDEMIKTPLKAACYSGNEKIVQLLLDKGSNVNQYHDMSDTPLVAACSSGNEKIVQLLLDKGGDVNQADGLKKTPLVAACMKENEKIVHLLIDKGGDVNQVDAMKTPLTAACLSENEKIVDFLLQNGSNVNQVDSMGETPLTSACNSGNEKIVQLIIDKGSDVNQVDGILKTHLTAACSSGNENIVRFFIDKGDDINQVDDQGNTPLTAACNSGNEKIVQLVINEGGEVNPLSDMLRTPLTAACCSGNEKIVQLLIDEGSDVNKVGGSGETPMTAACMGENEKIVQLLIDNGGDVFQIDGMELSPLTAACREGNEKIVELLIDNGCDSNNVYDMQETPMAAACRSGNEKIVEILIHKGFDVNQGDDMGESPLTAALNSGNDKIVQLLINKGFDVNQCDGMGESLLTAACNIGNEKMVQFLIDKGCYVNQLVDEMTPTPLIAACYSGNEKIVQLLIDKGSDVNQVDRTNETPLIAACECGNEKIVQVIIDKGGNVNQVGNIKTPLTAACYSGYKKIIQLLIEKGSDLNQVDRTNETPLTAACEYGNEKIVQVIIDKGGNVNQVGNIKTPLTAACHSGNKKIIHLLIDKGSEINQIDVMKETPLTTACKLGNANMINLLLDKGCEINLVNGNGETPLKAARMMGNENVAQLLIAKGCDVNKFGEKQSREGGKCIIL